MGQLRKHSPHNSFWKKIPINEEDSMESRDDRPNKEMMSKVIIPEMTAAQKSVLGVSILFLLVFCYMVVRTLLAHVITLPGLPGGPYGKMLPSVAFAFLFFSYMRGWKSTAFLFFLMLVVAWSVEECSIHTGFPFGHYYYSDMLGFKLDVAPVTLGPNYFWMFMFPTYFISNLIVNGSLFESNRTIGQLVFTSFIASILVAGIDMVVDPLDATKLSEWVWTKNNHTGYYGIPYINYLGYLIVITPTFLIFRLFEKSVNAKPLGPLNICIAAIPLFFYFLELILYGSSAPSGVFLVGCFTIGLPLLLAIDKLLKSHGPRSCKPGQSQ